MDGEIWKLYNNKGLVINQLWPKAEKDIGERSAKTTNIAIQINGKTRSVIELRGSIKKDDVEKIAIKNEKVLKHIKDKQIKKMIYVPNKVLNIVL